MDMKKVNISVPNLICLCLDDHGNGNLKGEFYHYYAEEGVQFQDSWEMIRKMDAFFDVLNFPQAATVYRSFEKKPVTTGTAHKHIEKKVSAEQLLVQRGKVGTFIVVVQYRQNTSWQGRMYHVEKDKDYAFASELEFISLLKNG